jgi:hypothetical protein
MTCGVLTYRLKLGRLSQYLMMGKSQLAVLDIQAQFIMVGSLFLVEFMKLLRNLTTVTFSICKQEFGNAFSQPQMI